MNGHAFLYKQKLFFQKSGKNFVPSVAGFGSGWLWMSSIVIANSFLYKYLAVFLVAKTLVFGDTISVELIAISR
jgi:hypothetical protein